MAKRRKTRKCRICKKKPVWRGGDVKNPGPVCKKCYHKHVWINRPGARDEQSVAEDYVDYLSGIESEPPVYYYERLSELPPLVYMPLPEPPFYRYPDEDEWAWICRTSRGESGNLPKPSSPLYPDEDDWAWICLEYRDE